MPDEMTLMGIGLLGAGFSAKGFARGLSFNPDIIASDGGTSDLGPFPLGAASVTRRSIKRDLNVIVPGARSVNAPLIFGSVATAGGDQQVDAVTEMVHEVAREHGLKLRVASIKAELDRDYLLEKLAQNRIRPFGALPELTEDAITESAHIVGMMGAEPFIEALDAGADVIIGGRAVDPAMFAAPAIRAGIPLGNAWHAARTMDKGVMITEPVQAGSCIFGRIGQDHFITYPTREGVICTPRTVVATLMYEGENPFRTVVPSGTLDTTDCTYEAVDERTVRASGGTFETADRYTVKIEGARLVGYRAVAIMGVRDPFLIADLDDFFDNVTAVASRNLELMGVAREDYVVRFRVYGRNAIMGRLEQDNAIPHEVGIVLECVAKDQETAGLVVSRFASIAHRVEFKNRLTTSGNISNPFSGGPLMSGAVYEWSAWHILEPDNWQETCRIEYSEV